MPRNGLALAAVDLVGDGRTCGRQVEYKAAVLRVDTPGADADFAAGAAAGRPRLRRGGARHRGQRHHRLVHGADLRHRDGRRHARDRRRPRCRSCSTPASGGRHAGRRGRRRCGSPTRPATGRWSSTPRPPTTGCATRTAGRTCSTPRPSDAMLTDALAQYPGLEALERLVPDRGQPSRGPGAGRGLPPGGGEVRREHRRGAGVRGYRRRAAHRHGPVQVQAQMPVFTQRAPEHDVVVAADRRGVCRHLPYHTWDPRPVAGSAGLVPRELASGARGLGRDPVADPLREAGQPTARDEDYQVWMALRALGEAATRTKGGDSADDARLRAVGRASSSPPSRDRS